MNLRSVDLNLLVALDALLEERHVTRAAERIGLSQPATSNALARLRGVFGDDLLVRGAGGMNPTPFALALAEPLRQALRQVERVLDSDIDFSPATAANRFVVRMSDLLSQLLLPGLLADLATSGPGIQLDVVHLPPGRTVDAIERDEVHVAVSMGLNHSASIRCETLLDDRMMCVFRAGHPLASRALTLETFLVHGHLKVSMSPTDTRFVDDVLAGQGLRRRVVANVPHWLVVPHVLATTDLVAVMPGRLAEAIRGTALIAREPPFATAPFDWKVYWHRRYDGSRSVDWLRGRIRRSILPAPRGASSHPIAPA